MAVVVITKCPQIVLGLSKTCESDCQWLGTKQTSPKTNLPMGSTLLDNRAVRQTIVSLIEAGAVEQEEALAWHLETAKLYAKGNLTPTDSAEHHFKAAAALGSVEASQYMVGLNLRRTLAEFDRQATVAGLDLEVFGARAAPAAEQVMSEYKRLRVGISKIRIINNAAELERLCRRKAPGAAKVVGFRQGKAAICGKEFVVAADDYNLNSKSYKLHCHEGWYVPFDACSLVSE